MHRYLTTVILALGATAALPAANISFSGASTFATDPAGAWGGSGITATLRPAGPCCQLLTVEPDTFNNGTGAVPMPSYTLTPGNHTLYLETSNWTGVGGYYGVNLYFEGDYTNPGISVYGVAVDDKTNLAQPFAADAQLTGGMSAEFVPGSGSLSFTGGGSTVTLTGYQLVPGGATNPYNTSLTVARIDLNVSGAAVAGVPEPGTFLLFGGALLAMGSRRVRSLVRRG